MDKTIGKILCCVGLSDDCHTVLEQAMRLASASGAKVHVLHAVKALDDDVMNTLRVNIRDKEALRGMMTNRREEARGRLERKLEHFCMVHADEREHIDALIDDTHVVEGYPAKVIVAMASKLGCDLIVMAANKRGISLSHAGKVTRGVLKRSRVPVVVVPMEN